MQAAAEWPELQESVAKLCAAWWQTDAPGKEGLITQTIPYLLVRALSTCKLLQPSSTEHSLPHTFKQPEPSSAEQERDDRL